MTDFDPADLTPVQPDLMPPTWLIVGALVALALILAATYAATRAAGKDHDTSMQRTSLVASLLALTCALSSLGVSAYTVARILP